MRRALGAGAMLAGALAGAAVTATLRGRRRWSRESERAVERLRRETTRAAEPATDSAPELASPPRTFDAAELAGLPAPAARFFRYALTPGQPLYRTARLEHAGEFALTPGAWRQLRSVQHVALAPPGFVWDATIRFAPGVVVRVRDGYSRGAASMYGALLGLVPVVDRRDTPGLAEGALLRWLGEAAAYPTALLPSAGVRWSPLDDRSARATFADAGLTVSMDVHFAAEGGIARIAALRQRDVNGRGVPTPFEGRWAEYRRIGGMMLPTRGEATWLLPGGPHTFWRARLVEAVYAG
ncbi:MAG TPA: DUF6544 family protein [Gemmatimonadales bacterium]|nr:DUF6544 family protein [Gemmatimonadales bacterium]